MNVVKSYYRSLRLVHWVVLAAVLITSFVVAYYHVTTAASCYGGTVLGRTCYRGYFTNTLDTGGDSVLPAIQDGQAIPSATINDAESLYNLIHSAYYSGNAQKVTGASFIYNTMMANNAPGIGRSISEGQWQIFHNELVGLDQAREISWGGNVSDTINSYWQGTNEGFNNDGSTDDDAYYDDAKNEPGILIRDYNGNVIYKILRRCANPIGIPSEPIPQPKNYTLTPHVDDVSPTTIEAGSQVSVNSSVDNPGEIASYATQWEITQITVQPGQKAPHEGEGPTISSQAPCQSNGGAPSGNYFQSGVASCKNVAKGSGSFDIGAPAQNLKPSVSGLDVGDLPTGTRVCFTLSVQPRANSDNSWAHSQPVCTVIGKKPKIQIWGGDIKVGGKIETSTSVKNMGGTNKTFGSWVEYGVFSVGVNGRFASGAGLVNQTNNEQTAWSKLTFANKDETGADAFGSYTNAGSFPAAPDVAGYFAASQNQQPIGAGSVDVGSLAFNTSDTPVVRTAGNVTVTGGTIPGGKSVVIVSTGTVTITGNLNYSDGPFTSVSQIPQLVIIAKNIIIQSAVGHIDAWLIASDTINTCSDFTGNLTSNKCSTELDVNGPVITGRLLLNRTAGSETDEHSGDPAERFNLRPDAFLWAQLLAQGSNKAQTVYSTELPPRF